MTRKEAIYFLGLEDHEFDNCISSTIIQMVVGGMYLRNDMKVSDRNEHSANIAMIDEAKSVIMNTQ